MNGNRGQYTSAPLYNMKNKRPTQPAQPGEEPQQPGKRRFTLLSILLSVVLPILFLLALLIQDNTLRWVFLLATGISLAAMWLLRAFVKNARGTLTVVYGALAVVIGLALFMNSQAPEARNASSIRASQGALFTDPDAGLGALLSQEEPTETPDVFTVTISAAQQQLEAFLEVWAQGKIPDMLTYCVPSWVAQQQSPESTLYQKIRSSRPVSYQVESVQGSDGDSSRTITLRVSMAELGSTEPVLKRLQVFMVRVNNVWYVDPKSLDGTNIDEAAESEAMSRPMIATTIAPTATPAPATAESNITLYYNPDGGKYYHASKSCSAVDERYWPLKEFSYADLNSQQFKNLLRCTKCGAPERPMQ